MFGTSFSTSVLERPALKLDSQFIIKFITSWHEHTWGINEFFSPTVFSSVDVACVDADDAPADMADCLRWAGVMPEQVKECQVPCKNECTFTSWSRFTQCQGCRSWRTRNRSLIGTTCNHTGSKFIFGCPLQTIKVVIFEFTLFIHIASWHTTHVLKVLHKHDKLCTCF